MALWQRMPIHHRRLRPPPHTRDALLLPRLLAPPLLLPLPLSLRLATVVRPVSEARQPSSLATSLFFPLPGPPALLPGSLLEWSEIPKLRVIVQMVPCQGLSAGHAQLRAFPAAKHNPSFLRRSSLRTPAGSLSLKSSRFQSETKNFSARAVLARTDFLQHDMLTSFRRESSIMGIPSLFIRHNHQRQRSEVGCRASSLSSFSYPELTSKPRWWWRTLACVPFLLPLHNMWSYADVIYQLHTYLQGFSLVYTFIDTMTLFPGWLFLVIFMTVYFFVVRRKWSPHFLRFHVILAILLDTGSQAVATMCTWMPSIVYQGKPMQYFWMSIAFIQIFTVLECMRCALAGMYPNVPFISHTAFIHSDLNLFR